MLYGDCIELDLENPRRAARGADDGDPRRGDAKPDVSAAVRGHGTGATGEVSTVSAAAPCAESPVRSFTLVLSVLGETVAGAVFLGGLFLLPLGAGRLLQLL